MSEATRQFLRGEQVALCVPHVDDADDLVRWDNDVALSVLAGDPARPRSVEAARAEIASAIEAGRDGSWVLFVVRDLNSDLPVGITELSEINARHRTATFGIRLGDY